MSKKVTKVVKNEAATENKQPATTAANKAGDGPKTPDPVANAQDKSDDPGTNPASAADQQQPTETAPVKVAKPVSSGKTVIADAEMSDLDQEQETPVNVAINMPAGTQNPPLHLLNKQAWAIDKARRDGNPLSGLERLVGQRNAQKLLRRLPEQQAKAERVRAEQNRKHHRISR